MEVHEISATLGGAVEPLPRQCLRALDLSTRRPLGRQVAQLVEHLPDQAPPILRLDPRFYEKQPRHRLHVGGDVVAQPLLLTDVIIEARMRVAAEQKVEQNEGGVVPHRRTQADGRAKAE